MTPETQLSVLDADVGLTDSGGSRAELLSTPVLNPEQEKREPELL